MNRYQKTTSSLLCLALAMAGSLQAQTAPTAAPETAQKDADAVVLSPFTVNTDKDTGYIASDSVLGGRLSTSLLKTPSDVSVLTRDFLNDIGVTDYIGATAYLTNTYAIPVASAQDFGTQANFRGLGGGFPTRNYFKQNTALDYYNVERVESARGPNALLFGDGIVGGIINTMSKVAKVGRTFKEFTLRVDSQGSMRGTADINVPIGRFGAARVNIVKEGDRSWIDSYFKNRKGATLAATLNATKRDEVRFEFEASDLKTNYSPQNFTDNISTWNGVPFVGPSTTNPVGSVDVNRFTTDRLTYLPGVGVLNLLNFGNSAGSNQAIAQEKTAFISNLPKIARSFTLQPSNASGDIRMELFAAYWQHQWTPRFNSEFAMQYAKQERSTETVTPNSLQVDINTTLPGGTPNAHFGQIYADAAVTHTDQTNRIYDYRFVNAYELPIKWWKQTINAMVSRRVEFFFANDFRWMRNNNADVPNLQDARNTYFQRFYASDNRTTLLNIHPTNDANYTWEDGVVRLRSQRQQLDTAQAATVATIWDERITFIGGFRHDLYKSREYQIGTYGPDGRPLKQATLLKELTANVMSSGLTFFPIPQLGAYANISQTFNPIGAGDASLYGKQFNYTHGLGYSGGLRFRLFDNRITGSLGYYDVTEANRVTGYGNTEINRIWANINQSQFQIPTSYRDTSDINSKGYELDMVANATRNLKIRANFGIPKTKQSNALPDTISYFNKNISTWRAAESDPLTTNVAQIESDISTLIARIQSGNQGRALNGQPDYTSSIFANYTIPSGILKQVSFGGGASVVGRRIIGNSVTNAFDYIKAPTYYTLTGSVGYSIKLMNRSIRLQLNVNNLLDYNKPVYTGIGTLSGRNYKGGFYYIEPRKFLLSATVNF